MSALIIIGFVEHFIGAKPNEGISFNVTPIILNYITFKKHFTVFICNTAGASSNRLGDNRIIIRVILSAIGFCISSIDSMRFIIKNAIKSFAPNSVAIFAFKYFYYVFISLNIFPFSLHNLRCLDEKRQTGATPQLLPASLMLMMSVGLT